MDKQRLHCTSQEPNGKISLKSSYQGICNGAIHRDLVALRSDGTTAALTVVVVQVPVRKNQKEAFSHRHRTTTLVAVQKCRLKILKTLFHLPSVFFFALSLICTFTILDDLFCQMGRQFIVVGKLHLKFSTAAGH